MTELALPTHAIPWRKVAFGLFAAMLMASSAVSANKVPSAPRVQLADGMIQGKTVMAANSDVTLEAFQGIPYASSPTGPLRWKPPQPVNSWTGVRRTTHFGARCMQLPLFDDMVFRSRGMSEDCLYLNLWKPARGAQKLPVLVYFYGGGFLAGDGSEKRYDGASLASKGIITITVNYRLGLFGFFALPALIGESPKHAAGNYGLLDQVAALRWVKANIARFGGDPSQVTIAGESAGSISVSTLMASSLARGLFARAIGESGALIAPIAPVALSQLEEEGEALAQKIGVDSLVGLRRLPAAKLLQLGKDAGATNAKVAIDGYLLTEAPAITFARGSQAKVPLLLGSNSQESSYTGILDKQPPTSANYRQALKKLFGKQAARALALYPGDDEAQVKRSATALASDLFIAHSTWRWMELHRRTGDAPVFYYVFDQPRPARRQPAPGEVPDSGAVHSGEIEYALGNLDGNAVYAWTADDRATSRIMQGYVANFIKTGDPNGKGLPEWPAVRDSNGGLLRQTLDPRARSEVDRGASRQRFLQAYFAHRPNLP